MGRPGTKFVTALTHARPHHGMCRLCVCTVQCIPILCCLLPCGLAFPSQRATRETRCCFWGGGEAGCTLMSVAAVQTSSCRPRGAVFGAIAAWLVFGTNVCVYMHSATPARFFLSCVLVTCLEAFVRGCAVVLLVCVAPPPGDDSPKQ